MKITIEMPDKELPDLQKIMNETGVQDLNVLFHRALTFYLYVFRLMHGGLRLAVLNRQLEIEGRLINLSLFVNLFKNDAPESDPPGQQEN